MQLNTPIKSITTLHGSRERILNIESEGYVFAYITDRFDGEANAFEEYDGVIILPTSPVLLKEVLHRFRSANSWTARLMPLFLHQQMELEYMHRQLVDGIVHQLDELYGAVSQIKIIKDHISGSRLRTFPTYEKDTIYKLLVYLLSREQKTLKAYIDRNSSTGYTYPILESLMNGKTPYRLMEFAVGEGLFTTQFQDSVYTCNSCEDGFLMYREACPKCHNTYLSSQDLIHHFACAHIGPERNFQRENNDLICPKCDKALKHIGIDYDKPAVMHHCNTCHHEFQSFQIVATCCSCHKTTAVEHLLKREILTYHLTDKAHTQVEAGSDFNHQPVQENAIPGAVSEAAFYLNMQYELMKSGKQKVLMGMIRWEPFDRILEKIGRQEYHLLQVNISDQVRSSLQSIDFLCVLDNCILFSCLHTSTELAYRVVERTVFLLSHLMKDNLGQDITFEGACLQLQGQQDVKTIVLEKLKEASW